jgi:hypothetical protein
MRANIVEAPEWGRHRGLGVLTRIQRIDLPRGHNASRVFSISSGAIVAISGLTIADGLAALATPVPSVSIPLISLEGGILNEGGTVAVSDVSFADNAAVGVSPTLTSSGGAIANVDSGASLTTHGKMPEAPRPTTGFHIRSRRIERAEGPFFRPVCPIPGPASTHAVSQVTAGANTSAMLAGLLMPCWFIQESAFSSCARPISPSRISPSRRRDAAA